MEKKYRLTEETKEWQGHTLHRIEALRSFSNIKKGELGGWIEKEENLSHDGYCWVRGGAIVCGNAKVYGYARACENAKVYGNVVVYEYAQICESANVFEDARVCGNSRVYGNANVFGNAVISDYAEVWEKVTICGGAYVCGRALICGNAVVSKMGDYLVFMNTWSSGRFFTWTKSNDMWKVGCFYGTGKELVEKAYKDSEISGNMYKTYVDFVENTLKKC